MKPKKLIRDNIPESLKDKEYERLDNLEELNKLYALKIKEELNEVQLSDHQDKKEFADLMDVVVAFAAVNGCSLYDLNTLSSAKRISKGAYTNMVLTNMNPSNPSNRMYFDNPPVLFSIPVPIDSQDFYINKVGCLRYTIIKGTVEHVSLIEPEIIGVCLNETEHEIAGVSLIENQKYVFFKLK